MLLPTPGGEGADVSDDDGAGQDVSGEPGDENPGEGTTAGEEDAQVSGAPGLPTGILTPTPEPTPPTGWIEYDDDWWDAQMGDDASSGYDDFYE